MNTSIDEKAKEICRLIMHELALEIRQRREAKHLSLRAFSRETGVSIAVISDLENEKYLPRMDIIVKFALALNISNSELFTIMNKGSEICTSINNNNGYGLKELLTSAGLFPSDILDIIEYIKFKVRDKDLTPQLERLLDK